MGVFEKQFYLSPMRGEARLSFLRWMEIRFGKGGGEGNGHIFEHNLLLLKVSVILGYTEFTKQSGGVRHRRLGTGT